MAQKQREMMAQVELAHQRELSEQLKKHDTLITEKQKGSHHLREPFLKVIFKFFNISKSKLKYTGNSSDHVSEKF